MRIYCDLDTFKNKLTINEKTWVTIGKFDGMHLGHRQLFDEIRRNCGHGGQSVVVSLQSKWCDKQTSARKSVFTVPERQYRFENEDYKPDCLVMLQLDDALSQMPPDRFVTDVLLGSIHMCGLAIGQDFRFGKDRAGDVSMLESLSKAHGFILRVMPTLEINGHRVSTSHIRESIALSDMRGTMDMLGHPFFIMGEVMHGQQIGRTLGFPTINQIPPRDKLLPPNGVYASRTQIAQKLYDSVTNIGVKPTLDIGEAVNVETYLLDFNGDVYGDTAIVSLIDYIRPERRFSSLDSLKSQMEKDLLETRRCLASVF